VLWTYLDRSNLAFSALSFKQYLHLDNAQYGLGSGAHARHTKLASTPCASARSWRECGAFTVPLATL